MVDDRLHDVTMEDLRRSVSLAQGVLDEEVMRAAWREEPDGGHFDS